MKGENSIDELNLLEVNLLLWEAEPRMGILGTGVDSLCLKRQNETETNALALCR